MDIADLVSLVCSWHDRACQEQGFQPLVLVTAGGDLHQPGQGGEAG
ncbi:hypothetical protein ACFOWE_32570 [Planomonospora corallina]|uniref:Uncharacterized protein n=1 Tax=Planomonospora corallina TaxID=1806052 RepID=A0ABV8IJ94_9ACTN